MENYQPIIASTLAAAMVTPEDPYNWEHNYAVQEITEHIGTARGTPCQKQVYSSSNCAKAPQRP